MPGRICFEVFSGRVTLDLGVRSLLVCLSCAAERELSKDFFPQAAGPYARVGNHSDPLSKNWAAHRSGRVQFAPRGFRSEPLTPADTNRCRAQFNPDSPAGNDSAKVRLGWGARNDFVVGGLILLAR